MGWFTKKKKKADSFDDEEEGGGMDDRFGDRGRGGDEGDDGPGGPGGGMGGGPGGMVGSDDNPYAEDPAHKHFVKTLDSNGLVRHRRAFIRNNVYTIAHAKDLDEERLKQIGVFLEADRKKLLRLFKDTAPVESVVDAEKEREEADRKNNEKDEDDGGKKSSKRDKKKGKEKEKRSKSKKSKKGSDDNDEKDDEEDSPKKKSKSDRGKKSKKGKDKGKDTDVEDDMTDEDVPKSKKKDGKKSKKGSKAEAASKKSKKSKKSSKKDDIPEMDDGEDGFETESSKSKKKSRKKDKPMKSKGSKVDDTLSGNDDDDLYGDEEREAEENDAKRRTGGKSKKKLDFSDDVPSEAEQATGDSGVEADEKNESNYNQPPKPKPILKEAKLDGADGPKAGATAEAPAKPSSPKKEKPKQQLPTLETSTLIENDGYESEGFDVVADVKDESGKEVVRKKRESFGAKALNVLSEKLGLKSTPKKLRKRDSIATMSSEDNEEERWWRSLDMDQSDRDLPRSYRNKPSSRRKLNVRPEFAAKVEYVTDEEADYLQDFRSRKHYGYNGPIAHKRGTQMSPASFHPNQFSSMATANAGPVPVNSISNVVQSQSYFPTQLPTIPKAEAEERELQQAKNLVYAQPNVQQTPGQNAEEMRSYHGSIASPIPQQPVSPSFNNYTMQSPTFQQLPPAMVMPGYPPTYYHNPYLSPMQNADLNKSMYYTDDEGTDAEYKRPVSTKRSSSKHQRRHRRDKGKADKTTTKEKTGYESEISLKGEDISDVDVRALKKNGIVNDIEYVDLSDVMKSKGHKSLSLRGARDALVVSDREIRSNHKDVKPQKIGSDNYFTESTFSEDDAGPTKHGKGRKSYTDERRINYYHSPVEGQKPGYESDTDMYHLRQKLAEIGQSHFYPVLIKQGITSIEECDLTKLEKLPIKSSAKSKLIKAISRIRTKSKNLKTKVYRYFSRSSTEGETDGAEQQSGELGLKSVLKNQVEPKPKRGGRSQSRSSPSRHYFEPGEVSVNESEDDNKLRAVPKEEAAVNTREKSVTFDLNDEDEVSLPSFSGNDHNSDSDMSLHSDFE